MPTLRVAPDKRGASVMPWGRYRGRTVAQLPWYYLRWLCEEARDASPRLRLDANLELARRLAQRRAERARLWPLPTAEPRTVCGIELDAVESALFVRAVRSGSLPDPLPPWLPCSSRLAEAWELQLAASPFGREDGA